MLARRRRLVLAQRTPALATPPNEFAYLDTPLDFRSGGTDLGVRGFDVLSPLLWSELAIHDGALHCEATEGGADGSWRFGLNEGFQQLGNGCDVEIESTSFDARATLAMTIAEDGGGQWEFFVLYIDPADARGGCPLSTHGGPGVDGATGQRGIETKYTEAAVSTYPILDTDELEGDIRCVRAGDLFTWYWRAASSGEPLESDDGWGSALLAVMLEGFPATVRIGLSHYSGPGAGISGAGSCERIRIRAIA
jgi:hypothetical protein